MSRWKGQAFIALFFILMTANVIYCHGVGREFIITAREMAALAAAGGDPATVAVKQSTLGGGHLLLLLNLPFLVGLGFIVRDAEPTMGLAYWSLIIIGSTYLPLIVTLCLFFLTHPPSHTGTFPGVEWDDGSLAEEEEREKRDE
jgi:hypothetical protein